MKFIYVSLLACTLVACDNGAVAPKSEITTQTKQASADNAPSASSLESDSSEGVVGPDDAYFAGVYLESVFKVSKANPHPALDSSLSLGKEKSPEAFDFAANLMPKRLNLMSRILISLGDKDKDGSLNLDEFQAVQLAPELQGAVEAIGHDFDKELFETVAGSDDLLSAEEIKVLLTNVAGQIQLSKLSKKEIRQSLEEGWEKILAAYDENKDGKMSLAEQRKLRKERASILGRFAAE
ncbi:MAG: hypothetical protein EOP10_31140 [Proteobacteria bacterium]|nr:MAG: hypothetical protein EOP10_31140 [Pseudomonadota bacterium]